MRRSSPPSSDAAGDLTAARVPPSDGPTLPAAPLPRPVLGQQQGRGINDVGTGVASDAIGKVAELVGAGPHGWTRRDLAIGLAHTYQWGDHSCWPRPLSVAQHNLPCCRDCPEADVVPRGRPRGKGASLALPASPPLPCLRPRSDFGGGVRSMNAGKRG